MLQRSGIPSSGYAGRAWIVAGLEKASYVWMSNRVDKALVGSLSTNTVVPRGAPLSILAGKTAGSRGVERRLMPAIGTPWAPGPLVRSRPVLRRMARP